MTFIRHIKCDKCGIKVVPEYNGEHWLPPDDWAEIFETGAAMCTGEHLCPKCRPKRKKSRPAPDAVTRAMELDCATKDLQAERDAGLKTIDILARDCDRYREALEKLAHQQ